MTKSARIAAIVLLAAASASCSSNRRARPAGPEAAKGLADSFTLLESRRGSDAWSPIGDPRVDYESQIRVRPDPAALVELAAGTAPAGVASTPLQRTLTRLVREIEAYTEAAFALASAAPTPGVPLSDDPFWREAAQRELAIVRSLKDATAAVVSERNGFSDARWIDGPKVMRLSEDEYAARYETAIAQLRDLQARVLVLDAERRPDTVVLSAWVDEMLAEQSARVALLESDARESAVEHDLGIEATLMRGGEPYPVSVEPYSSVENQARGEKSPRVSLPSAKDMERLRAEYAVQAELAASVNRTLELANDSEALARAWSDLGDRLRAYLEEARGRLDASLAAAIDASGLPQVSASARSVRDQLDALQSLVERLASTAPTSTPLEALQQIGAIDALVRGELAAALRQLRTDVEAAANQDVPALVKALGDLAKSESEHLEKAFAGNAIADGLGGLFVVLKQARTLASASGFGGLRPGQVTRRTFGIAGAPEATIQLANSPADDGDLLKIEYRLAPRAPAQPPAPPSAPPPGTVPSGAPPSGSPPTVAPPEPAEPVRVRREVTLLDVRKFGLYTTYGSQVLFLDRIGDGTSRFQAAPGLAVNLHYRPEHWRGFFDTVAPGIGLCVAAPSFENGTELGVGLQATFFHDTVQVGYLRDISVDDDPWAFYFGLDLIQAFRRLN